MIGSVYVHAPWCARRCFYCDFAVAVNRAPDATPWADLIRREREAHEAAGRALADRLATVFVGGGTPSLLGPGGMDGIRRALGPERIDPDTTEWTAEANPESFTPEVATAWRTAGLNRVSLGVQSFQQDVLRWMGRLHGAAGARGAVRIARNAGFEQISVDLIFALPAALDRHWRADLDEVLRLDVPHVSLYGLTAETGTPLGRRVDEGRVVMADEDRYRDEYLAARDVLVAEGYDHYEVSNFARPGAQARHNRVYWDGGDYLGLGNSAHSLVGEERFWAPRDLEVWRAAVEAGDPPVESAERVEGEARRLEEAWLALRTDRGLAPARLAAGPGDELRAGWVRAGLAHDVPGIRLTAEGWLVLDALAVAAADVIVSTEDAGAP